MFKVKTQNVELLSEHKPVSITPAMEQVYFKFKDGSEFTVPCKLTNELKASLNIVQQAQAPDITVDLTNPKTPVTMGIIG